MKNSFELLFYVAKYFGKNVMKLRETQKIEPVSGALLSLSPRNLLSKYVLNLKPIWNMDDAFFIAIYKLILPKEYNNAINTVRGGILDFNVQRDRDSVDIINHHSKYTLSLLYRNSELMLIYDKEEQMISAEKIELFYDFLIKNHIYVPHHKYTVHQMENMGLVEFRSIQGPYSQELKYRAIIEDQFRGNTSLLISKLAEAKSDLVERYIAGEINVIGHKELINEIEESHYPEEPPIRPIHSVEDLKYNLDPKNSKKTNRESRSLNQPLEY